MKLAVHGHSLGITTYIRKSNNWLYYVRMQHPTTRVSPRLSLVTVAHDVWASWVLKVAMTP